LRLQQAECQRASGDSIKSGNNSFSAKQVEDSAHRLTRVTSTLNQRQRRRRREPRHGERNGVFGYAKDILGPARRDVDLAVLARAAWPDR